MTETPEIPPVAHDPTTPFEDLPVEIRREVLGQLNFWLGIVAGALAAFCIAIVVATRGPVVPEIGWLIAMTLLAYVVPTWAGLYLLVLAAGAWPTQLKGKRLEELYGIEPSDMSNEAWSRMKGRSGALWYGVLGSSVVVGFAAIVELLFLAATGKTFGTPYSNCGIVLVGGITMVRAWRIRRIVADRRSSGALAKSTIGELAV